MRMALIGCLAALAAPASAQVAPEALSAAAGARFEAAAFGVSGARFRPTLSAGPRLDAAAAADWEAEARTNATLLDASFFRAQAQSPVAELELAPLLNRQLKTSLRYTLSGRAVWFSGAFDRAQNPYLSVLIDGRGPMFFNVKALVNQDQRVSWASASYTLRLDANIFRKMKSKLVMRNDATGRDEVKFSVQDMLDAVAAAGQSLRLSDQSYKAFYTDGIEGGRANPAERLFVFVNGAGSDYRVFLIPERLVPSDRIAVFKMFADKRVGLARRDGRLQVYENP